MNRIEEHLTLEKRLPKPKLAACFAKTAWIFTFELSS